ncbi:MAG: HAD-IIIA family hydrolase [Candidatus Omnitrophota bacterium]
MKILIIKFAAIGDVLRTTPILTALRRRYPRAKITWLCEDISYEVLRDNLLINRLVVFNQANLTRLEKSSWDLVISLDKDKRALQSAIRIPARVKKGFGQDANGRLIPFDKDSAYAYRLGIDDELKFRKNKKTYQEIIFEQAGLKYNGEKYAFNLDKKDISIATERLKTKGLLKKSVKVGIVTGSGKAFAAKRLPFDSYVKIIKGLLHYRDLQVSLLGGPREKAVNKKLIRLFGNSIIDTGCDNTIREFAAIINNCDIIITGDTLTMHLGIALGKYSIVFFGSTAANEIELYARGRKLLPKIKCSPCYKKRCPVNEKCMHLISPEGVVNSVLDAAKKILKKDLKGKIIFLDRDGVINKEGMTPSGYVTKLSLFILLPRVKEAVKLLKNNGYDIIIISNQGGVSKGLYSKATLDRITAKMLKEISARGGKIDEVYYCTHKKEDNCSCRKPEAGLFITALKTRNIDPERTYYIGDTERDVIAARKVGLKTITVLSGKSNMPYMKKHWKKMPNYIAKDLYDAVVKIVLKPASPAGREEQ